MKRHFTGDLWADAKLLQADERMTQARARAAATGAASTLAPSTSQRASPAGLLPARAGSPAPRLGADLLGSGHAYGSLA